MDRYRLLDEKITEMVETFVEEYFDVDSDSIEEFDVNNEIWSDKETFGKIAYEIIVEYFGSDELQEVAIKKMKEIISENEDDEDNEEEM